MIGRSEHNLVAFLEDAPTLARNPKVARQLRCRAANHTLLGSTFDIGDSSGRLVALGDQVGSACRVGVAATKLNVRSNQIVADGLNTRAKDLRASSVVRKHE